MTDHTPSGLPQPQTVAQLLFDFGGFLTCSERRWVFSSRDDASPMVEAIRLFAERKGIDLDNPPAVETVAVQDHETAQLVNRLTAIAREFGQTQQLRERIAQEIRPLSSPAPCKTCRGLGYTDAGDPETGATHLDYPCPDCPLPVAPKAEPTPTHERAAPAPEPDWKAEYYGAQKVLTKIRTAMNASGRWPLGTDLCAAIEALLASPSQPVAAEGVTDEQCADIIGAVRSVFGGVTYDSNKNRWEALNQSARNLIRAALSGSAESKKGE